MNPDPTSILELTARRYVALSEAQAAELGTGVLAEWREASRDGVHVDARDYVQVLRDGMRWRVFCATLRVGAWAFCTLTTGLALIWLLGLSAGPFS